MKRLLLLVLLLSISTLAQQACYFCNSQSGVRQVKFGRESYPLCNECRNKPQVCALCRRQASSPELLQDGNPGLQVEHKGSWVSAESPRGSLIINIGDVVQVWSNDRFKAPVHRVLASSRFVRYSAPFFLNPSFETDYAPLAAACVDEPARYRPINWGAFRAGRAAGDYANYGEEIQIAHFRV